MFSGTVFTRSGDPGPDVALPRSCWDVFHHVDGTTPIGAIADRLGLSDAELFAGVRLLEAQDLIGEAVMTYGEYKTYAASARTKSDAASANDAPAKDASAEEAATSNASIPEEQTATFSGSEAPPVDADMEAASEPLADDDDPVEQAASDVADTVASDDDSPATLYDGGSQNADPQDADPQDADSQNADSHDAGLEGAGSPESAHRGDGTSQRPSEPASSGDLSTAELNVEDITEEVLEQRSLHVPSLLSWLSDTMSNVKDYRNVQAFVLMEASDVLARHGITDVGDLESVDRFDDPDAILALEKAVRNNVNERIPETCYQ